MPRPPFKKEKSEYEQVLVDVARVARVVAGGKRFRFRVVLVLGNKKGKVGVGIAKGEDVTQALTKAQFRAKKNLISTPIINETIPHEITIKYGSARVFLKPARPGTGIIAGGPIRVVVEMAGIKNILSKMLGSTNKVNNVQATILALKKLKMPEAFAKIRGKELKTRVTLKR